MPVRRTVRFTLDLERGTHYPEFEETKKGFILCTQTVGQWKKA